MPRISAQNNSNTGDFLGDVAPEQNQNIHTSVFQNEIPYPQISRQETNVSNFPIYSGFFVEEAQVSIEPPYAFSHHIPNQMQSNVFYSNIYGNSGLLAEQSDPYYAFSDQPQFNAFYPNIPYNSNFIVEAPQVNTAPHYAFSHDMAAQSQPNIFHYPDVTNNPGFLVEEAQINTILPYAFSQDTTTQTQSNVSYPSLFSNSCCITPHDEFPNNTVTQSYSNVANNAGFLTENAQINTVSYDAFSQNTTTQAQSNVSYPTVFSNSGYITPHNEFPNNIATHGHPNVVNNSGFLVEDTASHYAFSQNTAAQAQSNVSYLNVINNFGYLNNPSFLMKETHTNVEPYCVLAHNIAVQTQSTQPYNFGFSEEAQDDAALHDTLTSQAQSLEKTNDSSSKDHKRLGYKREFRQGRLLEGIKLKNNGVVKLILKKGFDNEESYLATSRMLYNLYLQNAFFQDKFEIPMTRSHEPTLTLKLGHGYQNEQEIIDDFFKFVAHNTNNNIRKELAKGNLIDKVTIEEKNKVKLHLKEKYNKKELFFSINSAFYKLHKFSPRFRDKYHQPSSKLQEPVLILNANHGYKSAQQILNDLIIFADIRQKEIQNTTQTTPSDQQANKKSSRKSRTGNLKNSLKKALSEGRLLESVKRDGNSVILTLKEEYNDSKFYLSIYRMLIYTYKSSSFFKEKFMKPLEKNEMPFLTLKPNHAYQNDRQILADLIHWAKPISCSIVKEAQIINELFTGVTLEKNIVKLNLNKKYDNEDFFKLTNGLLKKAFKTSVDFKAKFYLSSCSHESPMLILKPNHGYENDEQIFNNLLNFLKPNFKESITQQTDKQSLSLTSNEYAQEEFKLDQYFQQEMLSTTTNNELYDDILEYSMLGQSNYNSPMTPLFEMNKASNDANNTIHQRDDGTQSYKTNHKPSQRQSG